MASAARSLRHVRLLILGSGGRGESLLAPDQDNAIVHDGRPEHDPWFLDIATRISDLLDAAGIPYCKGKVMATNPDWRRSLDGWRGVMWAGVGGTLSVLLAARLSSDMVLRLYGAREMTPTSFPEAHQIVRLLSERAELPAMPRLYRVPSRLMNAFSAGTRADSIICVTDGLLARYMKVLE